MIWSLDILHVGLCQAQPNLRGRFLKIQGFFRSPLFGFGCGILRRCDFWVIFIFIAFHS